MKPKVIHHVRSSWEMDFFFDEDYKFLHCWSNNDAMYRKEYMTPLFKKLGIEILEINEQDPKVYALIRDILKQYGLQE